MHLRSNIVTIVLELSARDKVIKLGTELQKQ